MALDENVRRKRGLDGTDTPKEEEMGASKSRAKIFLEVEHHTLAGMQCQMAKKNNYT